MIDNPEVHGPRQVHLRHLLNEWDPIGVADLVDDEYDCLLAPLWDRLTRGATPASLSEYLWSEVEDHFGLDPERCGVNVFAERLLALAATWSSSNP